MTMRRMTSMTLALFALLLCAWQEAAAPASGSTSGQASPGSVVAARAADTVFVITLHGEIDSVTSYSIQRRLTQAADAGADAVVLDINSPGGELGAVLEITGAIKKSTVPITVAWINPQAYSGGAIIALACQEIVVTPAAQMGDAFPVTFTGESGRAGLRGLTPDERTKLLPPLLADVVDSARRSGFDEYLVQAMVTDEIELWLIENPDTGQRYAINENEYRALFDRDPPRNKPMLPTATGSRQQRNPSEPVAEDTGMPKPLADEELHYRPAAPVLKNLTSAVTDRLTVTTKRPVLDASQRGQWTDLGYITDGSAAIVLGTSEMKAFGFSSATVANDEELKAFFGAKTIVRMDQSWSETASRFLTTMGVRFVLIAVFLLALFIEMSSPGIMLPGAIAIGAGVLLIAPPMIIGMANWWEIGAILLGIVFIMLEIFVLPGFGIFGIIGLVALFGGLIGTFIPNGAGISDPGTGAVALKGMVTILLALFTAGIGMYFVSKHFGSLPLLGRLILENRSDDERELSLTALMGDANDALVDVGDEGVTTTPLKPVGQAEINDRIVDVVSDLGFIDPGTPVRVISTGSMRVVVEPISGDGENA
jgi:membrane-bound serine protease (ClpP class)